MNKIEQAVVNAAMRRYKEWAKAKLSPANYTPAALGLIKACRAYAAYIEKRK